VWQSSLQAQTELAGTAPQIPVRQAPDEQSLPFAQVPPAQLFAQTLDLQTLPSPQLAPSLACAVVQACEALQTA
jgi:hypothetical protein